MLVKSILLRIGDRDLKELLDKLRHPIVTRFSKEVRFLSKCEL